jgi:hypothetical protein
MPLQVILATAPTQDLVNVSVSLHVSSPQRSFHEASLTFGPASHVMGAVFDVAGATDNVLRHSELINFAAAAPEIDDPAVPIEINANIHSGLETVGFTLKNLFSNDTLHLLALSHKFFLGNVFHQRKANFAERLLHTQCRAKCADGKSSQGCVTCVAGGITVKICC